MLRLALVFLAGLLVGANLVYFVMTRGQADPDAAIVFQRERTQHAVPADTPAAPAERVEAPAPPQDKPAPAFGPLPAEPGRPSGTPAPVESGRASRREGVGGSGRGSY